jgi:transcriptional regulator with PAS, ATPase and Fis domain
LAGEGSKVGDLDVAIQVKLSRVLQTRTFQPLGDTTDRHFHGKLIAATNRDLSAAMQEGHFREDFYYRLCSDLITIPSLREQLRKSPDVLRELLVFIARRVAGDEVEALAGEVGGWVLRHLGRDYPWPGNIRELREQCVRNVLVRGEYRPWRTRARSPRDEFSRAVTGGTLTADELLRRYCALVYSQTGSYEETARRLQLYRRTVKGKVRPATARRVWPGRENVARPARGLRLLWTCALNNVKGACLRTEPLGPGALSPARRHNCCQAC